MIKKAWSSKPPPIPNLWEHQAQATNTKSIAWTSTSIDQLVGYALGSKKEIYPRDGEKSNHHHHQMLPSSRKNCQLSYRLCEFLLNSVKRWCLCLDRVVWSQHSLLWKGIYIKNFKGYCVLNIAYASCWLQKNACFCYRLGPMPPYGRPTWDSCARIHFGQEQLELSQRLAAFLPLHFCISATELLRFCKPLSLDSDRKFRP